ncbi:MAG TPA: TlpA disulfide reductase family protein [Thermodesulfovibrionales bacterium]|nr:TlpA disulfide reductase family protein [Thermodesulfovibrionales bacterium]
MRIAVKIIVTLLTFLFLTAEVPSPWAIEELVGNKAPDFTLKDIAGRSLSLSALKGKTVLVSFWATWCPPCRNEMPSLNRLYKAYKDRGLIVLAVSTDRNPSTVKNFLSEFPADFPVFMDVDMQTSRQYRVFSMPTAFLVDRNGVIVKRYLGEEDWDSPGMRSEIIKVLNAK